MTSQQKISVLGLGVFAIAAITLGLLHINQGIIRPITPDTADDTLEVSKELAEDTTYAELSSKDTDNDGLNDYEELHVFGTSPYLTDTDGDDLDDAVEIQSGGDPNCPTGRTCGAVIEGSTSGNSGVVDSIDPAASYGAQDMEPDTLRKLLAEMGFPSEQITSLSDDQIVQIFEQALVEQEAANN